MIDLFHSFPEVALKNRIVMPPMTRNSTRRGGVPSPELADYYVRRAENGVGLIIVASAAIGEASFANCLGGFPI